MLSDPTFVEAEEPQLLDDAPSRDLGAAGNLARHLQPDLDNLQRIREHHLHRIPRRHSINVEEQCFGYGSAQIRIKKCLLDPDLHGQMQIRIQEVKKPKKCTGSLGKYRTGRIKVRILF